MKRDARKRRVRRASTRPSSDPSAPRPLLTLLAVSAVVFLVAATFQPVLDFEFIRYDVREQLLEDPSIQELNVDNIRRILTTRRISSYYPVRTLTFALDYHFWQFNPRGFKLTNLLIHISNTVLTFWLVLRVQRVGPSRSDHNWRLGLATFASAAFGVHPLVVEPVAWIGGREELLMTLGALGCLHFHLTARRSAGNEQGRRVVACYVGSAICCALACLSNAVGVIIPLLVVAWDMLGTPRATQKEVIRATAALWLIALATFVIKVLDPNAELLDRGKMFSLERVMLVANVFWLNLKSLVWPAVLTIRYPHLQPQSFANVEVIMGGLLAGATCFALWMARRQQQLTFGMLWVLIALLPAAQIMPHHLARADRFLYLPMVGFVIAVSAGIRAAANKLARPWVPYTFVAAGAVLLAVMQTKSARQLGTWRNEVTMWRHCAQHNPEDTLVHATLAHSLNRIGQYAEAQNSYERALETDPQSVEGLKYFALFLSQCPDERFLDFERAVELVERAASLQVDPLMAVVLTEVYTSVGQPAKAMAAVNEAIATAETAGNLRLAAQFMEIREQLQAGGGQKRTPAELAP